MAIKKIMLTKNHIGIISDFSRYKSVHQVMGFSRSHFTCYIADSLCIVAVYRWCAQLLGSDTRQGPRFVIFV